MAISILQRFYNEEIVTRKTFIFPPFARVVKFLFTAKDEERCHAQAESFRTKLLQGLTQSYTCHPIVPSGHAKIKDHYRFQFLVRGPSISAIASAIEEVDRRFKLASSVTRYIDVDPTHTF